MNVMSVHATYKLLNLNELEAWSRLEETYLSEILKDPLIKEYLVLRTCNRVEFYLNVTDMEKIKSKFVLLSEKLKSRIFFLEGLETVKHLMRVCSGMDSMVIGEQDIQRQVKNALELASTSGTSGKVLNYIFMKSLSTGKEVRESTKITKGIVSIPQTAIRLLEDRAQAIEMHKICVVGYGRIGKTLLKSLVSKGWDVTVCGRNEAKMVDIANNLAIKHLNIKDLKISDYDCVITAVNVSTPIIKFEKSGEIPKLIIDLGNPRNVISDSRPEYVDLDELKKFVDQNIESRKLEINKAESIIDKNIQSAAKKLRSLEIDDIISQIYKNAEQIRKEEINETVALIGAEKTEILENLTRSLTNKLLAAQTKRIKKIFVEGNYNNIELLKYVFGVEKDVSTDKNEKIARKSNIKRDGN